MSNYKISRRKFITSSGVVFTLPLLESLFPFSKALAQAANDPRRFVVFYFPNGTYNRPTKPIWATKPGDLNASNTSLALSPFANYYGEIISLNYLKNDAWGSLDKTYKDEHSSQAAAFLTCADSINSTTTTIEHAIADKVGKPAFVLSGGVTNADRTPDNYISYRNGKGNPGISNPGDLYRSLLNLVVPSSGGGGGGTPVPTDNSKSILDSAIADFNSFNNTLGKSDRAKMDEFLTSLRELENKVAGSGQGSVNLGGACVKPTLDPALDSANSKDTALYLPKFYAFNDMIKIAFACDITRSVSVMVDTETTNRTYAKPPASLMYNGADISGGYQSHIAISHAIESTNGYNLAVTRDRVLMQIAIDLADKLKSATDPSGSRLLDNTIIQAGFGVEDGNHSIFQDQRPLVLVGGKNMITGGKSYNVSPYQMKDLYYSISSMMGVGLANYQGSTTLIKL